MSGLKRASSSTNIPLPKADLRRRSKSTSRASLRESTENKRGRSGSMDKLAVPKLSFGTAGYKKTAATPTSGHSGKKRSIATPLSGASGYRRSDHSTPSTSRSRSPFTVGSERKVNDPKWVSQQFAKVRNFLQNHPKCVDEQIFTSMKSLTINSFVYIMNLLLKEIDPHVEVTTINYKDIVLNTLKTLHYPGRLTTSLLKTVNTNHAWPHIVSIFSWLVDLILTIRRVNLPVSPDLENDPRYKKMECLTKYVMEKYFMYNKNENTDFVDNEFEINFGAILNLDENEGLELAKEVEALKVSKEIKLQSIEKLKKQNEEIKKETETLKREMDQYYATKGEKLDEVNSEMNLLKERRAKLMKKVLEKRNSVAALSELVKHQPCTSNEKKRIVKHISEMKHTIDLKKEKLRVQKEVKDFCEEKLVESKQKLDRERSRLNNQLLKLVLLEPKLKILHIKEGHFNNEQLEKEVQHLIDQFKMHESRLNQEFMHLKYQSTHLDKKIDLFLQEIDLAGRYRHEIKAIENNVIHKIEQFNVAIENMLKIRDDNKRVFAEKVKEFKEIENDYLEVNKQYEETKNLKENKEQEFEKLKVDCLKFFQNLNEVIMKNLVEMDDMFSDIVAFFKESLEKIEQIQADLVEDLGSLDSVKEN